VLFCPVSNLTTQEDPSKRQKTDDLSWMGNLLNEASASAAPLPPSEEYFLQTFSKPFMHAITQSHVGYMVDALWIFYIARLTFRRSMIAVASASGEHLRCGKAI
jgi:hypothetical protein